MGFQTDWRICECTKRTTWYGFNLCNVLFPLFLAKKKWSGSLPRLFRYTNTAKGQKQIFILKEATRKGLDFWSGGWVSSNEMFVIEGIVQQLCPTWKSSIKLLQIERYVNSVSFFTSEHYRLVAPDTHPESNYAVVESVHRLVNMNAL